MTIGRNPAERSFLRELVAEMEHKAPYASILINENRSLAISSATRMDRVNETGPQAGAVLTAWTGEHFEEEVTSDLSRDGLAQAARNLIGRISVKPGGLSIDPRQIMRRRTASILRRLPSRISWSIVVRCAGRSKKLINASWMPLAATMRIASRQPL